MKLFQFTEIDFKSLLLMKEFFDNKHFHIKWGENTVN